MKSIAITVKMSVAALAAVLLGLIPFAAEARAQAAAETIIITVVDVKPEMSAEFEAFMKDETRPAMIKGGVKWYQVWTTANFGTGYQYTIAQPVDNLAVLDGPGAIEKAIGKDGYQAWVNKIVKYTYGFKRYVISTYPALSFVPANMQEPKFAVVNHVSVATNRNEEYETWFKDDMVPVISKSGIAGFSMSRIMFGGDPNEYISLTLLENYADVDKGSPASRVLGQAGAAQLLRKIPAGVIVKTERYFIRYRSALSYRAEPASK